MITFYLRTHISTTYITSNVNYFCFDLKGSKIVFLSDFGHIAEAQRVYGEVWYKTL